MPTTSTRKDITAAVAFGRMTPLEQLAYVRRQLVELETEAAVALVSSWGDPDEPADPMAVKRLVLARYLAMTLRLKEHSL